MPNKDKQSRTNMSFSCLGFVCVQAHACTAKCACAHRHMCMCVHASVCVCVSLSYNKHWSKTGPSCQAAAVTTNNDYPLPAPQFLLHNHQRRGDPPLLGEQCIHEWASSSPKPTLISPLRAHQTLSVCVFVWVWISANLCVSVRFFQWAPLARHSLPRPRMIQALLAMADYIAINTYGLQIL